MYWLMMVRTKVTTAVKEVKEVVSKNPVMLGVLLVPVLAPHGGPKEFGTFIVDILAIVAGIIVLVIGIKKLLKEESSMKMLLDLIVIVIASGLIVSAAYRLFTGNALGDVFYNWLVGFLSEWF